MPLVNELPCSRILVVFVGLLQYLEEMKTLHKVCAILCFLPLCMQSFLASTGVPGFAYSQTSMPLPYEQVERSVDERIGDLLSRMTLEDKIGQMTLVDIRGVSPEETAQLKLGAVLSGGGAVPEQNTPQDWYTMVGAYEQAALSTPLHIPLLYGIDAVHGHGNLYGATVFPHNIGLGAANDANLVERIGAATAKELAATNIFWNFAPALEVPQDYRWGRTYEGFSADTDITAELGAAYITGLQKEHVVATAKHYVSAGAATWGTSGHEKYAIDQGGSHISEQLLRNTYLPPFQAALNADVKVVMVSLNTWNDIKLHAHKYLLTDVLKTEMGFDGFVVSDWDGVKSIGPDYHQNIVDSINAGMDMIMLPGDPYTFINELTLTIQNGEISMERIDDAVTRILRVKFSMGYFYDDDEPSTDVIGSAEHRALAREAVQKSAVLLKNEHNLLPLSPNLSRILVAGQGANDIGMQSGGWTMTWQGGLGAITEGTTILEGIRKSVSSQTSVEYSIDGTSTEYADVGIVVIGEQPYAEGMGDKADLHIAQSDIELINRVKEHADNVVVILLSGRPLVVDAGIKDWDAFVAAWLPGTEGNGVSDVLFGKAPFSGTLPFAWKNSKGQTTWPFGYGLLE